MAGPEAGGWHILPRAGVGAGADILPGPRIRATTVRSFNGGITLEPGQTIFPGSRVGAAGNQVILPGARVGAGWSHYNFICPL